MESQKCWKGHLGDLDVSFLYHQQQLRSSGALPRLSLKNLKDRNSTTHLSNQFPRYITLLAEKGPLMSDLLLCRIICNS